MEVGEPLNVEHQKMLEWLKTVRFRRALVGGLDEADVWKKLEELNNLYDACLVAERARYDALLEEQTKAARQELAKYRRAARMLKTRYEAMKAALESQEQEGDSRESEDV